MKKCFAPLVALLVCAFIFSSCSNSSTSPTPTLPAATTPFATNPVMTTPASPMAATSPPVTPTSTSPTPTKSTIISPMSTNNAKYGGMLRRIEPSGPGTPIGWNPETSGNSVLTMQLSLQFLLREQLGGKLTPQLAASYEVNADPNNPSVTFKLQKGVKFSDGTDFNAQAVKWNLDMTKAGGMSAGTTNYWKSVEVIDDYTVQVNFTMYQNRMVRGFGDGVAYICSPTAYQKNGVDWMRWHMVGTGPFLQTDFQRDVSLTVTRNPNYFEQGYPYLDSIQLLYVTDEMTRIALFKSGGAEILNTNGNGRITSELQAAGYKIMTQGGGANVLVPDSLNTDSPWSNLKVRQAAEYAIDKDSLVKAFGYGYWKTANQVNPTDTTAYDATIPGRNFDVAKAKQLMADAGYPNGFKTRIIAQTSGNRDIPVFLQASLSKIGITADLEFVDSAKFQQYSSGTWSNGLLLSSTIERANPNATFNFFFGVPSTNFPGLKKPDGWKDILIASLNSASPDPALMKKCENALYDDATVIPLYFGANMWAVTNNVQDSGIGTRGQNTYWEPAYTWLSK